MRDMREGINKAINVQEEDAKMRGSVELTERDKAMIEHGYIQCALQIGTDIGMKNESFMAGLQEITLRCAALDEAEYAVEATGSEALHIINLEIRDNPKKVKVTKRLEDTRVGNVTFKAGTKVYQCPSCNMWVTPTMKFCCECGQKIMF